MSPMKPADYHPQWSTISRQVREQANNRCEFCGRENGSVGCWDVNGQWFTREKFAALWTPLNMVEGTAWEHFPPSHEVRWLRTVLTVAHLCHDTHCIDPAHLRALCQRCHLRYDAQHHAQTRRENRADRTGQMRLEVEI